MTQGDRNEDKLAQAAFGPQFFFPSKGLGGRRKASGQRRIFHTSVEVLNKISRFVIRKQNGHFRSMFGFAFPPILKSYIFFKLPLLLLFESF